MEGDKRKTREDTWKPDELKKHLRVPRSDSHSEDRRHRERKSRDRDSHDTEDYKGYLHKDHDRERIKSKEKAGEKQRLRSSERPRDERKEKGKVKDHPKERERLKTKATHEKHAKEEKHSVGKDGARHSGKERERRHKKDDSNPTRIQNIVETIVCGEREKKPDRRRDSKDSEDHQKIRDRDEDRERRHSERKNEYRNHLGDSLMYRDEEHELRHKSHKEQELDKDRKRRHREKRELEHSGVEGKERQLKERNPTSDKDRDDGRVYIKHKEHSHQEETYYKENGERRQKEENERKKRELQHSQEKSLRHEDERDYPHDRKEKEKVRVPSKSGGKSEKEDTRREHHKSEDLTAKESSQKRQPREEENELIKTTANPSNQETEYDNYSVNYEDDFEDYEDDFDELDDEDEAEAEDESHHEPEKEQGEVEERVKKIPRAKNAEIEAIQKAINAENERLETFLPRKKKNEFLPKECEKELRMERQDSSSNSPISGKFIDFQTAKQRQSIRKIVSKQKKRSSELLRLIDLDFSVSVCLLDLPPVNEYDMYIRNFGKINTKQAYVQWNEDNLERDVQTEEIETQEKWTQHPGETALVSGGPKSDCDVSLLAPKIDSQRLASFLRSACQVIAVLLEEDRVATQPRWNLRSRQTSLSISDSCFQLNTNLPFLHGRKVSCLHISEAQRQALLSVHELPEKSSDVQLDKKYIICTWNVWQPSIPQKLLFCESQVTCCCFSPSKATLVFAGTTDGSVLVWDLREDSRMHLCLKFNDTEWTFRSPTFSTDGLFTSVNHMYPVLTIEPISTSVFKEQNCGFSSFSSQEDMLGLSFQIGSMDENGSFSLWVVIELQKGDEAGSQSDLGLIPGGKVKLVHSSTVQLNCSVSPKDTICPGRPQTTNIKFLPSDPNHFIVGTDIVGCSDGSIRLHQMTSELPLMQWNNSTGGQPIIALQWALTRPAVFFALDATSVVYIWDLLESDLSPIAKQPIQSDRVLTMTVLGEPEKPNGLLGIALAKESGIIDIQYVKKKWALPQPEESEKLNLLLLQAS